MKKISLNNNKILIGSGSIAYYENPIGTEQNLPIFSIDNENKISIGKNNKITVSGNNIDLSGYVHISGNFYTSGGFFSCNVNDVTLNGSTIGIYGNTFGQIGVINGNMNVTGKNVNITGNESVNISGSTINLSGSVYLNGSILIPGGGESIGSIWSGYSDLTIIPDNGRVYIHGSKLTFGYPNYPVNYPYLERIGPEDIKLNNGNGKSILLSGGGIDLSGSNISLDGSSIRLSGSNISLGGNSINLTGSSNIILNGSTINLMGSNINLTGNSQGFMTVSNYKTIQILTTGNNNNFKFGADDRCFISGNAAHIDIIAGSVTGYTGTINIYARQGNINLTGSNIGLSGNRVDLTGSAIALEANAIVLDGSVALGGADATVNLIGSVYLNGSILIPGGGVMGSIWSGYSTLSIMPNVGGTINLNGSDINLNASYMQIGDQNKGQLVLSGNKMYVGHHIATGNTVDIIVGVTTGGGSGNVTIGGLRTNDVYFNLSGVIYKGSVNGSQLLFFKQV